MSLTPSASASLQPAKMKKDESFLGKLGGTLARKKRAKEAQKNITASPGQNVSLPCRVPNNKPAFIVKWTRPDLEPEYVLLYRDELLDPEEQHPSYQNRVDLQDRQMKDGDVSLVLKNLTTNDRGTYECRVFQREANGRKRRTLTSDPISSIFLDVAPPTENMEGSREDGSSHQHLGAAAAVLIIALTIGSFAILMKQTSKEAETNQDSRSSQGFTNELTAL